MFHIGILVPDLESAAHRLSSLLDVTFVQPRLAQADVFDDRGAKRELELLITYSREGPPHLELLQSQGDEGLYAPPEHGLHHVGLWEPDPEAVLRRLQALGVGLEASQHTREGSIIALYTEPADSAGTRFEYVNTALRPGVEEWITTSDALPHDHSGPPAATPDVAG